MQTSPVAAGLALLLMPLHLPSQQPSNDAFPATVVLLDALPIPHEPFLVQRRPGQTPADVILLRRDATAQDLSDAIRTLLAARRISGDNPAARATIRRRPTTGHSSSRIIPWAASLHRDLHTTPLSRVEGVGTARALRFSLPVQYGSRATRVKAIR